MSAQGEQEGSAAATARSSRMSAHSCGIELEERNARHEHATDPVSTSSPAAFAGYASVNPIGPSLAVLFDSCKPLQNWVFIRKEDT